MVAEEREVNLAIDKSHTGDFYRGQTGAEYTIEVSNQGPDPTKGNVTVTDDLPAGLTATAISGTGWNCVLATLTCTRSDELAAGDSYPPITMTVDVAEDAPSELINSATVEGGGDPTPNTDDDPTTIEDQKANLTVTKTPNSQTINAGDDVVFTIQVDNAGPGTAKGVTLSDALPSGTAGAWVEDPDNPDCQITGNQLDCDFGDMASGASRTVTVKAPTDIDNCAVYDNTATASATNADDAQDDAQVTCQKPDLTVTKTPNSQTINAGDDVVFTIQVDNAGPGTAKGVTLSDALPSGTAGAWVEDPDNPDCQITGNQLDCDFGDMASGLNPTGRTLEVRVRGRSSDTERSEPGAPARRSEGRGTDRPPGRRAAHRLRDLPEWLLRFGRFGPDRPDRSRNRRLDDAPGAFIGSQLD